METFNSIVFHKSEPANKQHTNQSINQLIDYYNVEVLIFILFLILLWFIINKVSYMINNLVVKEMESCPGWNINFILVITNRQIVCGDNLTKPFSVVNLFQNEKKYQPVPACLPTNQEVAGSIPGSSTILNVD